MRNVALMGRREFETHRQHYDGITATLPTYKEVDSAGNKEWVCDVYLGPSDSVNFKIAKDVPIAPFARELVGGARVPVLLERSRQGKLTVVGRAKVVPAGAQIEGGSVLDPTYRFTEHNLADLGLLHVADLTWVRRALRPTPDTPLRETPDTPLREVRAFNAFGRQVVGPESYETPAYLTPAPVSSTQVRHVKLGVTKLGPRGDAKAMRWGTGPLREPVYELVTLET